MFKLILFLFLAVSAAHAETIESMLASSLAPANVCPPETAAQICATSLCGPAPLTKSLTMTNESFAINAFSNIKNADQLLKEIQTKMLAYYNSYNENIDKIRNHVENGNLKIDFSKWRDLELLQLEHDVFKGHIQHFVDPTKPLPDRLEMVAKAPDWMKTEHKIVLEAYAENLRKSYLKNPGQLIDEAIYTRDESKKILTDLWSDVSRFEMTPVLKEQWEERMKNLDSEESLSKIYNDLSILQQRFKGIAVTPGSGRHCFDSSCLKVMKDYAEKNYKSSLKPLSDKLYQSSISKEAIEDWSKTCLANFVARKEMNQKAEEFAKNLPGVIDSFISNAMKSYSPHSRKVFRDFLKTVNFNLKYTKPQDLGDYYKKLQAGENALSILASVYQMTRDPLSGMEECSLPYTKSDHVVSDGEKHDLELSYYTCTHEGTGKGLLAHELGHLLSYATSQGFLSPESRNQFLKARDCLSSRHKKDPGPPVYGYAHGNDHLVSEEDHADFLAENTFPKGPLFTCALLNHSVDGKSFEINLHETGEQHSNPFLRLIWQAKLKKGKLPDKCEEVFKDQKDYELKTCKEFK